MREIRTLGINHAHQVIISDIDDCLIKTSDAIKRAHIKKKSFWMNEDIYNQMSQHVFIDCELTNWGHEINDISRDKDVHIILISAAPIGRFEMIKHLFPLITNVLEGVKPSEKVEYLNQLTKESIYVDDKINVIKEVRNKLITLVNYPKIIGRTKRMNPMTFNKRR